MVKFKKKTTSGRPYITIDWDKVDKLLEADYTGQEIAAEFGIHPDTLYDRTISEKGVYFSDYSAIKTSKGKGRIKLKQYSKALEGNVTMLIYLGKTRLKQVEARPEEKSTTPPNDGAITDFLNLLKENKELKEKLDALERKTNPELPTSE